MKIAINSEMNQIQWSGVTFIQCDLYSDLTELVEGAIRKITNKKRWTNSKEVQEFLNEINEHLAEKMLVLKQAKPEVGGFHVSSELVKLIGDKYATEDWFKNGVKSKWALGQMVEMLYATALENLSKNGIPPYEAIDKNSTKSQTQQIYEQVVGSQKTEEDDSFISEEDDTAMKSIEETANEYRKNIRPVRNPRADQKQALETEREQEMAKSTPGHQTPRGIVNIGPKRPVME